MTTGHKSFPVSEGELAVLITASGPEGFFIKCGLGSGMLHLDLTTENDLAVGRYLVNMREQAKAKTKEDRARVLAEHTLTPGGWECEGSHAPGSSPLWETVCSWNDCPELRRVLTPAEHTQLIEHRIYPADRDALMDRPL